MSTAGTNALPLDGFLGVPTSAAMEVTDNGHTLRVRMYRFPDGTHAPYVEAQENHAGPAPVRVWPLSEVVHVLQNATWQEFFGVAAREPGEIVNANGAQP